MTLAIPTLDEYAALMSRLNKLSAPQKAPTPTEAKEEGNAVACAQPYTGWTIYGYWHEGVLLRGRP